MKNLFEIYYYGDLGSEEELALAVLDASQENGEITFSQINPSNSEARFNYLIPIREGLGGDGDFGVRETFELILAFGTVQAFLVFAKAFLSKSGEIVAEKLFDRLSKEKREEVIAQEKQQRASWKEEYENAKASLPEWVDNRERIENEQLEWWRAWGEAGEGDLTYNADIRLTIYVEEKDSSFEVAFEFDHDEEEFTIEHPFIRTPRERFRELIAKEILNFRKALEQVPETDHAENINRKKEMKREFMRHLSMIDEEE